VLVFGIFLRLHHRGKERLGADAGHGERHIPRGYYSTRTVLSTTDRWFASPGVTPCTQNLVVWCYKAALCLRRTETIRVCSGRTTRPRKTDSLQHPRNQVFYSAYVVIANLFV
jgi:hypothetical protein